MTIDKFIYRFNYIESKFRKLDIKFADTKENIELGMKFWEEAKHNRG